MTSVRLVYEACVVVYYMGLCSGKETDDAIKRKVVVAAYEWGGGTNTYVWDTQRRGAVPNTFWKCSLNHNSYHNMVNRLWHVFSFTSSRLQLINRIPKSQNTTTLLTPMGNSTPQAEPINKMIIMASGKSTQVLRVTWAAVVDKHLGSIHVGIVLWSSPSRFQVQHNHINVRYVE